MLGLFRFWGMGTSGEEILDRPLSNFDVIGIPTRTWSSSLLGCLSNIVPSCIVSFLLPCVSWAQVVVRAQIPLLIGLKNSLPTFRTNSGYGLFVDYFNCSVIISAVLVIIVVVVVSLSTSVRIFLVLVVIALMGTLCYLLGHTRTAFREKYSLPGLFGAGAESWDLVLDFVIMLTCLPCALSQMLRHVFQYDRMDTRPGLFLSDPSSLPPLRPSPEQVEAGQFERPRAADEAGLGWTDDRPYEGPTRNTGLSHRQQEIERQQREQIINSTTTSRIHSTASAPVAQATSVVAAQSAQVVYNADGTRK